MNSFGNTVPVKKEHFGMLVLGFPFCLNYKWKSRAACQTSELPGNLSTHVSLSV